jgi:hypothetical protein
VLELLEKSLGVVTTACNKANISRTQFYKWYNEDAEFAAKVKEIDDIVLDFEEIRKCFMPCIVLAIHN